MARIVIVHGAFNELWGPNELKARWLPAVRDGLWHHGVEVDADDVAVCFYGDLFRHHPGSEEDRRLSASRAGVADMLTEMGGDAIPALAQAAGEATFDRTVDLATAMLSETGLHERLRARIEAEVTDDTRVLVAHSLGTVLSYSALAAHDDWPVHTFVTLGSPLAAPMLFNSLEPAPVDGLGVWPGSVQRWVNVRALDDKACETCLADHFGPRVEEQVIDNGHRAHAPEPYLNSSATGAAIAAALGATERLPFRRADRPASAHTLPAAGTIHFRWPTPEAVLVAAIATDPTNAAAGTVQRGQGRAHRRALRMRRRPPRASSPSAGRVHRAEEFRDDGATSTESWAVETLRGVGGHGAHARPKWPRRLWDAPHLVGSLRAGEISFDKVRAVVDVATPETERALCAQAKELSVRDLAEVARSAPAPGRSASPPSRAQHDGRYLRFNDQHRTMSVQFPAESYAADQGLGRRLGREDSQRRRDAVGPAPLRRLHGDRRVGGLGLGSGSAARPSSGSGRPFFVVAHVPLEDLVNEDGDPSELAGELERHGLIDVETVQRIACDATVVVAVDDASGHTMYEGRARSFPDRGPEPRGDAPGPPVSVPRLFQRHLHRRPPRHAVAPRR